MAEDGTRPNGQPLLAEEARDADGCVAWLHHCHAECCWQYNFRLTPDAWVEYVGDVVRIHTPLTEDVAWYYELHRADVDRDANTIEVRRDTCRVEGGRLHVRRRCRALTDDGLCGLHDTGKPETCAGLTAETADSGEYLVTPRCLFRYARAGDNG